MLKRLAHNLRIRLSHPLAAQSVGNNYGPFNAGKYLGDHGDETNVPVNLVVGPFNLVTNTNNKVGVDFIVTNSGGTSEILDA